MTTEQSYPSVMEHRVGGVLVPLFALCGENDLGIGDIAALREGIRWAKSKGLGFIQLLPINYPGSDHSPYNLLSSMAIDPLTISCHPRDLPEVPFELWERSVKEARGGDTVDYGEVTRRKNSLLEAAAEAFFERAKKGRLAEFERFVSVEREWLEDFALYATLREIHKTEVFDAWPSEHRSVEGARHWLESLKGAEADAIKKRFRFHKFVQWVAIKQWTSVSRFAEKSGTFLIGDVPVGVSIYSVDVWANPQLFRLDLSSGAPPEKVFQADSFTAQWGQNWGFPLYNWYAMSKDNFRWWRRRLQMLRRIFRILRVDHALGFFRIYAFPWRPEQNQEFLGLSLEEAAAKTGGRLPGFVPYNDDTEENRRRNLQHGETLLGILVEEMGAGGLIAEDLGEVPPYVRPCLARMGLPGFKIPQWERLPNGRFIPGSEYPRVSIATYATHDHPPLRQIWDELVDKATKLTNEKNKTLRDNALEELQALWEFCGEKPEGVPLRRFDLKILRVLLRGLWKCNSWLAAVGINDLFATSQRFNVPGTSGNQNWTARIEASVSQWNSRYSAEIRAWSRDLKTIRPLPKTLASK
ncbi:MAG: 4-alpha-glucanotransferase [Chthoniobacterales bacterium]|nr:4-alpha-glucanotransferase [Chthoniobacterales bacterium]